VIEILNFLAYEVVTVCSVHVLELLLQHYIGLLCRDGHIALLLCQLILKHPTHTIDLLDLHGIRPFLVSLSLPFLLVLQALLLQPFPLCLCLSLFALLEVQILAIKEPEPADV
jgi:hypothetical protein